MSLSFKDVLANDLSATFFNLNEFAESYTLIRRSSNAVVKDVAAILNSRAYPVLDDGNGNMTSITSIDFDVLATSYATLGIVPLPGDRFENERGEIYEVMPIDAAQCFETADGDGKILRVHTKRVKA